MTHEELLSLLQGEAESAAFRMDKNAWLVVSDITELHRPEILPGCGSDKCFHCEKDGERYPCKTIQLIEKELL
jgi:hypothetical protein